MVLILCLCCSTSQARFTIIDELTIDFKSFDELFAYEYQPKYIIDGYIDIGPYSYDVYTDYTIQEQKQIYQVCEKQLPWQYTLDQEQWERTMYMYQWVVKPHPFPYDYGLIPIPTPSGILLCSIGCIAIGLSKLKGWNK